MTSETKTKPPPSSAVDRAAQRLRVMAIEKAEGELIGSEDELMAALQVSRPTESLVALPAR